MTLNELKQARQDLFAQLDAIEAAAAEQDRGAMTEEQLAEYRDCDAKIDDLDEKIAEAEKVQAMIEKNKSRREKSAYTGRKTSFDSGTPTPRVKKEGFEDDPKRGFSTHAEFLTAIMDAASRGKVEDSRLNYLAAVGSDENMTVSDPYGGFLLPTGFLPNLLSVTAESDPTAGRTTAIPMTTQQLKIPARVDKNHTSSVSGGLQVYRRNETDTVSATRMEFEQITLNATSLFGLSYATEEVLERSPISFVALLEAGFGDEFAAKLLKEKLFGTGAGEFEGVVNAGCVVSQTKETGQAASTIVYENVIKMRSRCWGYGNAIWIANHDTMPQLMLMNQSVGTGGLPVWQPSARDDHPDMLLGRPLFFSEFAETVGTLGDIICGNWTQYLEGTLSGQRQAESVHVRFINHERTFKFWMENDGAPWWLSALTPNQSSTTLSPFVILDARA